MLIETAPRDTTFDKRTLPIKVIVSVLTIQFEIVLLTVADESGPLPDHCKVPLIRLFTSEEFVEFIVKFPPMYTFDMYTFESTLD